MIEHHISDRILFKVDHDTHTFTVRLIINIGDAIYLLLVYKVSDFHYQFRLIDHVWYLPDNNLLTSVSVCFDLALSPDDYSTPTGFIAFLNTFITVNNTSGREIRSLYYFCQFGNFNLRIIN